jgi:hypothetical protein
MDDKTLDAAVSAKGFAPAAVRQRKIGATSAWAVVEAPRNTEHEVVEFDIFRVRADGVAVLPLTPPTRDPPATWDSDVVPFDIRDLDGDGHEECVLVLKWLWDLPKSSTGEATQQLYVISGGAGAPKVGFTSIVDYATLSQQQTDHDRTDPPSPEHIAYEWKITGKPPVLSIKRTEFQINRKRRKGLTDPATEPMLSSLGEGTELELDLK